MKRILVLLMALVMVLGTIACDAGAGTAAPAAEAADAGPTKLRMMMYTNANIQAQVEEALVPFEEAHNCDVEVILNALDDFDTKISTMLASNDMVDVLWVAESHAAQYISEGLLADISDLTADPEWDYDDYAEGMKAHFTRGDAIYGAGFSGPPTVCFYNKTLYDKAGLTTPTELYAEGKWDVDTMIEQAYKLAELGDEIYGIDFSMTGKWDGWDEVGTVAFRLYGGDAWDDNDHTKILVNSPESIKGLTVFNNMMNDGVHPKAGTTVDFLAGQLGLYVDYYGSIKKLADVDFEWDVIPMPLNEKGFSTGYMGAAAYGVYAGTNQPELAKELVKYMTSKEQITNMQFTFIPPRKSILYSEAFATGNYGEIARSSNPEANSWIVDTIDKIHVKQSHENLTELAQCLLEGFELMYAGALTPEEAANHIAEEMEPYMEGSY